MADKDLKELAKFFNNWKIINYNDKDDFVKNWKHLNTNFASLSEVNFPFADLINKYKMQTNPIAARYYYNKPFLIYPFSYQYYYSNIDKKKNFIFSAY